jgi:hypothetical protein
MPKTLTWMGLLALLLVSFARVGDAQAPRRATHWEGQYFYADRNDPPVPFKMDLEINGNGVRGRISEPATFGDRSSPQLFANLTGILHGRTLSFTKTYDGTGGQTHSVQYSGDISQDGQNIAGQWITGGTLYGKFAAHVVR